jgi:4-amino-4-deoxy-L-arabinose transferase-like glycosyltransferase
MNRFHMRMLTGAGWLTMVVVAFVIRPLIPVDETRYVTVAWEMWVHRSFAVPLLNGLPYAHKPPLFFWFIHAGWALFGVSEWWPRFIEPLCALINLVLLDRLACRLWPGFPKTRYLAPLIFVSTWFVAVYLTAVMFDMLLLTCILGAWLALHIALRQSMARGFVLFGAMLGLGLLAKGPVVLVYTLPLALAGPWWRCDSTNFSWPRWYALTGASTALGAAIAGVWLVCVVNAAGKDYFDELLVGQTAERVAGALGHGRPFWWYLPILPALLLPWIAWPAVWRGLRSLRGLPIDSGLRFVGIGVVSSLFLLSAIGGKQIHYLLPLLSLTALLLARAIDSAPKVDRRIGRLPLALVMSPALLAPLYLFTHSVGDSVVRWVMNVPVWCWGTLILVMTGVLVLKPRRPGFVAPIIATLSILCVAVSFAAACRMLLSDIDLEPLGRYLGQQQKDGHPLAAIGNYQGQFGFYGRLQQPIAPLIFDSAKTWALNNPSGLIITKRERKFGDSVQVDLRQHIFDDDWMVISSANLLHNATH